MTTPRITAVAARPRHRLFVKFEDGVEGVVSLGDRLFGPVFAPLKDPDLFRQVALDAFGAPSWPTGADLAPDALYETLRSGKTG